MTQRLNNSAKKLLKRLRTGATAIAVIVFFIGVAYLVNGFVNLMGQAYNRQFESFAEKKVICVRSRKRYWINQKAKTFEEAQAMNDEIELLAWRSCFEEYGGNQILTFFMPKQ